ncbi:MAG: FAD-dependent oxidoreductase [Capsulimonas sp.]|uniref:FAD-dependent oxidoreductase n=1 Tax=Capsulimonas sp. TaxID=2494211 RepID=UPI00326755A3
MITLDILRQVPLFSRLDDKELTDIAAVSADVNFPAGQWVLREGERSSFYILIEGGIEVTKENRGEDVVIKTYVPGTFFGEVPLMLGGSSVAGFRTTTDARVLKMDEADFHNLLTRRDDLTDCIMEEMIRRVSLLQQLSVQTPVDRIILVGYSSDVNCYDLRQFLSGNHQNFRWLDPADPTCQPYIPEQASEGPYPIVVLSNGEAIKCPDNRSLAKHLGLKTEPADSTYDVVIIGGGPAGLAAAVYGASEGLRTLMIERSFPGGQAGTSSRIENYLGFPTGISGNELGAKALRQATRFGSEILVSRSVKGLCPKGRLHEVVLEDGETITTRVVILATGVSWRSLFIPGAKSLIGCGIFYGAARTEAMGVAGKDVYLIGGGNSAGQAAMFFADYASKVTLLIRASNIEQGMSQYLIDQLKTRKNIAVEVNSSVSSVCGDITLEAITVKNSQTGESVEHKTDSLFVFIGADAETHWLPETIARDDRGYILTGLDATLSGQCGAERRPFLLETSVAGIFAAGDVRHGSIKRVASGVGEGSMAIAFVHQYLAECATLAEPPPSVSG